MGVLKEVKEIPVKGDYDVIVAGAGVAGISAALAAGRSGCRVLLIEKSSVPGGLATLGLVTVYLSLCDGKGRKVIGGISEELLHAAIKYGYDNLPEGWTAGAESGPPAPDRYRTRYSAPEFMIAIDELLEEANVEVLYDTIFSSTVVEGGKCRHVIMENKSGRQACGVRAVVDATGDADVMHRSGAKCIEQDNYLSLWILDTDLDRMRRAVEENDVKHGIGLRPIGTSTGGGVPPAKYLGTRGEDVSRFIMESRKLTRGILKDRDPGKESFLSFPGMPQFRTTRRIHGLYTLSSGDELASFEDSIGCAGDWRRAGPVYEIPYRTLISPALDNVITAGRTISAEGDTWEVTRVIPVAAMTGHAAGKAASISVRKNCSLQDIDPRILQAELAAEGVIINRPRP